MENQKMKSIIRANYQELMQSIEEDEISQSMKIDIEEILNHAEIKLDEKGKNEVRDMAFRSAEAGEEAGFVRGFRYAFQLFMECLS